MNDNIYMDSIIARAIRLMVYMGDQNTNVIKLLNTNIEQKIVT